MDSGKVYGFGGELDMTWFHGSGDRIPFLGGGPWDDTFSGGFEGRILG